MIRKCIDKSIIVAGILLVNVPAAQAVESAQAAIAEYNSGHYPAALSQFLALEKQYPNNAMAHYYTGLCRQAMGQISEAKAEYQWVSTHDQGKLKQYAAAGLANLGKAGSHNDTAAKADADAPATADAASDAPKGKGGAKSDADGPDLSNVDPNVSSKVQQAIDMAKKAGVRIGKDGKPISMKDTATPEPAAAATDKPGATKAGAPKVAALPKVRKIIEFCQSNNRACILFDDTFTSTMKQFSNIQFTKVTNDDEANPLAAKYNVSSYPTIIYLGEGDKVLDNSMGAPMGDAFAEKIKSLNTPTR